MDLVAVDSSSCPQCRSTFLTVATFSQPAMVRHGGYGATRTTTVAFCAECDWSLVRAVSETRPDVA